jgi:hypothetical protein
MQYIALAFDTPEPELPALMPHVNALAQAAGYQALVSRLDMAGDGLSAFVRTRSITQVVFLNCPSRKSLKFSSDGIIQDLENSVWEDRPSAWETFLAGVSARCSERPYYVIMGQEWFVHQYVKYYEGPVATLVGLLRLQRGWQTPLFNFETESAGTESETPLVFRVNPST